MQETEIRAVFQGGFEIKTAFYSDPSGHDLWVSVLECLPYVPVAYTTENLDYQADYMRCFLSQLIDLSIIIYHADKPIGIFPITLNINEGDVSFRTNEGPVYTPLYVTGTSEKLIRRYNVQCLSALQKCYEYITRVRGGRASSWESQTSFLPTPLHEQSMIWYRQLMERGAAVSVSHELYVDLHLPIEVIHQKVRKSYRSLLNEGEKLWRVDIPAEVSHELFTEYRLLHKAVAGRETRSLRTWDAQESAIRSGAGFIVTLRNDEDELIGGAHYAVSRDEGVYAVAAYRRDLFDEPVSHVAQWAAIRRMKELGLRWYYVGTRFYPTDSRPPTPKELQIAYFKEGFATDFFFKMITENRFAKLEQ